MKYEEVVMLTRNHSKQICIWMCDLLEDKGITFGKVCLRVGADYIGVRWEDEGIQHWASVSLGIQGMRIQFGKVGGIILSCIIPVPLNVIDYLPKIFNEKTIKETLNAFGFPNVYFSLISDREFWIGQNEKYMMRLRSI